MSGKRFDRNRRMATKKKSSVSKSTSRKKSVSKKTSAKHSTDTKKKAVKRSGPRQTAKSPAVLTSRKEKLRQKMIAEAAYFLAEQRGFKGGSALEDWLIAEAQVDRKLSSQRN
jgi:hypothetical protein